MWHPRAGRTIEYADVAQWQSISLVMRRLWVRFPPSAPKSPGYRTISGAFCRSVPPGHGAGEASYRDCPEPQPFFRRSAAWTPDTARPGCSFCRSAQAALFRFRQCPSHRDESRPDVLCPAAGGDPAAFGQGQERRAGRRGGAGVSTGAPPQNLCLGFLPGLMYYYYMR